MTTASSPDEVRIVPANEASPDDVRTIFGPGEGHGCQCQFFKLDEVEWRGAVDIDERARRLREQTRCGDPRARSTSGLIAYWHTEPVGWCAIEPRTAYSRLLRMRVPWSGRDEDKTDDRVWALTCFVVRRAYRRRGVASALAAAAIDFARERGARAIEGYPRITRTGEEAGSAYLYVGSRDLFAAAGFREVSRPTQKRAVMRVDF